MQSSDDQLRTVLQHWCDSLIDLSRKNRLLNFKHRRSTTLEISAPDVTRLLTGLAKSLRFAEIIETSKDETAGDDRDPAPDQLAAVATRADEIVTQKTTQQELDTALRGLLRDSNRIFADTGEHLNSGRGAKNLVDGTGNDWSHVCHRVVHRTDNRRNQRTANFDGLAGARAFEQHLDDPVFSRVAGVVHLELIEQVRIERRRGRLCRRDETPAVQHECNAIGARAGERGVCGVRLLDNV